MSSKGLQRWKVPGGYCCCFLTVSSTEIIGAHKQTASRLLLFCGFGETHFYSHPTRSFGEIRSLSNPWKIKKPANLKRILDGRSPHLLTPNPRLEASRLL